ncbi:hypothetical protein nublan012_36340 [Klebsiella pneumoniae]
MQYPDLDAIVGDRQARGINHWRRRGGDGRISCHHQAGNRQKFRFEARLVKPAWARYFHIAMWLG